MGLLILLVLYFVNHFFKRILKTKYKLKILVCLIDSANFASQKTFL